MAKKSKKAASELTTDEVLDRLFGKGAAKKIREVLAAEDSRGKGRKKAKPDAE